MDESFYIPENVVRTLIFMETLWKSYSCAQFTHEENYSLGKEKRNLSK